jgi:N-methylhydantoinase A
MVHDLIMPINKTQSELRLDELNNRLTDLLAEGKEILRKGGVPDDRMDVNAMADMKYFDQFRPISVEIGSHKINDLEELKDRFHKAMIANYAYDLPQGFPVEIEVSDLHIQAIGKIETVELGKLSVAKGGSGRALKGRRKVYFSEGEYFIDTAIYERRDLSPGDVIEGPAIIEQPDSTTVMPPEARCSVDEYGNLLIRLT